MYIEYLSDIVGSVERTSLSTARHGGVVHSGGAMSRGSARTPANSRGVVRKRPLNMTTNEVMAQQNETNMEDSGKGFAR